MWPQGVRYDKGILGKLCRQGHKGDFGGFRAARG